MRSETLPFAPVSIQSGAIELTNTRLDHRLQRLRIGEAVIIADFHQRPWWQTTVGYQLLRVLQGDHIVGPAVQDDRAPLHCRGGAPVLPSRAEENQRRLARAKVHGDCAATGGADDHVGLVLVVLGLSGADGGSEVVVIEGGVDDVVPMALEVARLHAARNRTPAVQEEDFHFIVDACCAAAEGFHSVRSGDRRNAA